MSRASSQEAPPSAQLIQDAQGHNARATPVSTTSDLTQPSHEASLTLSDNKTRQLTEVAQDEVVESYNPYQPVQDCNTS